jgi:hypothetical protein
VTTNIKLPLVQWNNAGYAGNTAIGYGALCINTTGSNNFAQGYLSQEVGPSYAFRDPEQDTIILSAGGDQEMLKITKDGFYVRGVKVEQDEKEAEAVYKAFKRWLVENELRRDY